LQQAPQALGVGRRQGAEFVVAVQEMEGGALGEDHPAAGKFLVDRGDAAVLGMTQASDQSADVIPLTQPSPPRGRGLGEGGKSAETPTTDRAHVLREAIMCCRKGGTLSVPGVYTGFPDTIPFGPLMNKALTVKTGQTHVQRYSAPLLKKIQAGEIDPSFVITHRLKLEDGPAAYKTFRDKRDGCIKVVLNPWA
jgi:threonine dehydrogenase-like Zn-dependent dehydrogenase